MKVVNSQIPEENGKPEFSGNKNWKTIPPNKIKAFLKEGEDFEDEEEDEDIDDKYKKTLVNIGDEQYITLFDIQSVTKEMKFFEKPSAHWKYGIAVNKGIVQNSFVKCVDLFSWYSTEELRDEKFTNLLELLKDNGFVVLSV